MSRIAPATDERALSAGDTDARRMRAAWILGIVGVVGFGGTMPFTKLGVVAFDPAWFTALRAALAGGLAVAWLAVTRAPRPAARDWPLLALASLSLVVLFPFLLAVGMRHVPAAHGGVVFGVLPVATVLGAAALGFERPSRAFLAVSALGAGLVVLFALRQGDGSGGGFSVGDLALAGAVASTALGYALSARLSVRLGGAAVISWALVLALPLTVPAAFLLAHPWPMGVALTAPLLSLAYVVVVSQWLGFFAWNKALALGGTSRIGQVQLLQIFVTLAWSALLLGERIDAETLLFAAAVVAVVATARRLPVERR